MSFPFAINGHSLNGGSYPALKNKGASFSIEAIDGSGAGRNQEGTVIRDLIAQKIKWQLTFAPCTSSQLANLLSLINGETFSFTYPNPVTGTSSTGSFYVGARSAPVCLCDSNGNILWDNLSFNVIEI